MLFFSMFFTTTTNNKQITYLTKTHSLSLSLDDDDDDIEQGPLQQSTEWHHSIIDWLSCES